ncbi:SPFH domain-containing protein [Nocardiopsis chromatogenes]|uniref:SPFH domain-containing protein n=1 Tax=Nocardiopsis chromatogenes TaxID=280239 RepID=UPI00034BB5BE|nr:SPFH domain-containing protein [Nocardiopsis chromatogenes]
MGLFDSIRGELIDIIEWTDDSRDTMVWRFPRHDNEIKMGAQLIVRESQNAVFINEGRLADVYPPGTYTLQTQNMPVLSTLKGWKYGFDSPFKAEVYFVNTRQFTDMKWGTKNPVMVRDPEFGPVRLRAFGGFSARVADPGRFLTELVGTDPNFRTEEIEDHLRQMIVGRFGPALAKASARTPVLDLAAGQEDIGDKVAAVLSVDLADLGLEIPRFIIENVSLPEEVEEALDKRTQMGILGDMGEYQRFQAANALENSSQHPGGASDAMSMGMGMAAAQQMAQSMQQPAPQQAAPQQAPAQAGAAVPPPLPGGQQWYVGADGRQMGPFGAEQLQGMAAQGTLTQETLVWSEGMAQWTAAGQVPQLANLFGAVPPPLPPQA